MNNKKVLLLGTGLGHQNYPHNYDGEVWGLAKSLVVRAYVKSPLRYKWLIKWCRKTRKKFMWANRVADEIRLRRRTPFEFLLFERPEFKKEFEPAPPRLDKIFLMDKIDNLKSVNTMKVFTKGEIVRKINETKKPCVIPYEDDRLENAEVFPLKEIRKKFGLIYFTNSICFMIALALARGARELDLWGIAQAGRQEYQQERRGVEYWLGVAVGMGVKVNINPPTKLFTHDNGLVYGYQKTPKKLL